ncbi:CmpA/NrtA family ABC transporter substrate-binding protein [Vreelandella olivaria]|uniref:CmpA/NrtA family ABC transporter substrate-binding protein n=1 Tax=Vreelandella olivaria TaxID=390919 RepID=UPI00201EC834|nr:CmpA/NrtA family ABC transporter substrate-binding protein [Halomonas olivaria]
MSKQSPSSYSPERRHFLKSSATVVGGSALFSSLPVSWAFADGKPETTAAKLGFIALTDAAPLFVADEKGFFAKHGMTDVEVLKQSSWGTMRDNLVLGSQRNGIDGVHILTPMVYQMTLGSITNNIPTPMTILARLNIDGQGISISNEYRDLAIGTDAAPLKEALAAKRDRGEDVRAAMTFPGGTHDLWLRYWMAAGGIDPNRDISTIVVPPPQMVANMRVGSMDACCVGAPWNGQLVNQEVGYSAVTTGELWPDHPEKVLSLRTDYVDANPNSTKALLMAVMEAQIYCDQPENREEVAQICSRRRWINAPVDDIIEHMRGNIDYGTGRVVENSPHIMRFWNDHASYPFKSHDLWFLTENIRWGYMPQNLDTQTLINQVNREDIWREAAQALGVASADIPDATSRGSETFFDGKVFDPENPQAYLDSLEIKALA